MEASRFSNVQKALLLKQAAKAMPVANVFQIAGISQAIYFSWKKKYGAKIIGPIRLVVVVLSISAMSVGSMVHAAVVSSPLGTPPIAIEVHAEPIKVFDSHDPSRQRFGQLEFRGGLTLTSPIPRIRRSFRDSDCLRWRAVHLANRPWTLVHGADHL